MLHGISTSDWHLGGMSRVLQDPTSFQMKEIEKPYAYALNNSIKHVFVPGDVSDTDHINDHTLVMLISLLLKYDSHVKTWYIRGNHDVAHKHKTSLDVLEFMSNNKFFSNFRVFSAPKAVSIDDVTVGFIPFPNTSVATKRPPLLFAHVEEPGAVGDNGRPLKTKESQVERSKGDFMISGHIHQYQYLESRRTLYNGSLFQKNFGESLPKGFVEFKAKYEGKRLEVDHEFINSHPNFELQTVHIKKSSDWAKIKEDTSIRYKVLIDKSSGIVVPKDITLTHPNIVYLNGVDSLVKVQDVHEIGEQNLSSLPKFNPVRGLKSYLSKAGLESDQIRLGIEMTKEAWAYLSK